jgi:two-component system cell cycle sensor histidine kinase/response regulator CckA
VTPQRILIVDDEREIRDFVAELLRDANFTVEQASDGLEAMRRIEAGEQFDLLLTDVRMPGLNGFELVRRLKQVRPGLRVLFMSGYAAEYRIDPDREDFLPKPFRPQELVGCVFEILGRKPAG